VEMLVRVDDRVSAQQPLFTVHAETCGELAYAMDYLAANANIIGLEY